VEATKSEMPPSFNLYINVYQNINIAIILGYVFNKEVEQYRRKIESNFGKCLKKNNKQILCVSMKRPKIFLSATTFRL